MRIARPPNRLHQGDHEPHIPYHSLKALHQTFFLSLFQFRTLLNSNRNFYLSGLKLKTVQFFYSYLQNEFCRCYKTDPAFLFTSTGLTSIRGKLFGFLKARILMQICYGVFPQKLDHTVCKKAPLCCTFLATRRHFSSQTRSKAKLKQIVTFLWVFFLH